LIFFQILSQQLYNPHLHIVALPERLYALIVPLVMAPPTKRQRVAVRWLASHHVPAKTLMVRHRPWIAAYQT